MFITRPTLISSFKGKNQGMTGDLILAGVFPRSAHPEVQLRANAALGSSFRSPVDDLLSGVTWRYPLPENSLASALIERHLVAPLSSEGKRYPWSFFHLLFPWVYELRGSILGDVFSIDSICELIQDGLNLLFATAD